MSQRRLSASYESKVKDLCDNAEQYHNNFYNKMTFDGPSLYFHLKALGFLGNVSEEYRNELIYGVLVSWGMHRMGRGGAKMTSFDDFNNCLLEISDTIKTVQSYSIEILDDYAWNLIKRVYGGINVMRSKVELVGNSKVMAHLFPQLIAPIDRQYTIKYLYGNKYISEDSASQWLLFRKIHEEFYYPVLESTKTQNLINDWVKNHRKYRWDSSPLKIVDNLVIGFLESN